MKKKLFITFLFGLFGSNLFGQKVANSIIASGYSSGSCGDLYMSATIGQTIIGTSSCGSFDVIIGFQQPLDVLSTGTFDHVFTNVKLYPNPAIDMIFLKGDKISPTSNVEIKIIDALGRVINGIHIDQFSSEYHIAVSTLTPGIYSLLIADESKRVNHIKFIKN